MTEKICFSEKEKKDLIRGFNEDRKNMFTSSGSGQEYFQKKVLKKIDNL
jgi:nitrate reductase alpha subunit